MPLLKKVEQNDEEGGLVGTTKSGEQVLLGAPIPGLRIYHVFSSRPLDIEKQAENDKKYYYLISLPVSGNFDDRFAGIPYNMFPLREK